MKERVTKKTYLYKIANITQKLLKNALKLIINYYLSKIIQKNATLS